MKVTENAIPPGYQTPVEAPHRVLVVDDEENVALTVSEILRRDGAEADVATSGEQALQRIRVTEYDVVLADLRMENVDGISVISETRRISPTTVTIILTGFASLESAVAAMRHGAYDYLIKPCVIDDLKNTVRRGVERRRLIRDVDDSRRRLEAINRSLESRVEEKTAELRRLNEELALASRAKDVFFATLSHELRTPLTPILNWARVLRSDKAKPEMFAQGLEVIERNAWLQARLVDDLLDVSRIISGKLSFESKETDVRTVVINALETVREPAAKNEVRLVTDIPDTTVPVMGSEVRLQQIVWNLLSNAVKFTDPGGQVRLSLGISGDAARVVVSDTGIGIDPEFLPHLFDVFSQSPERSESQTRGGMGLGLAIVKRLVELHGGGITVQSEGTGKGATFTFFIPLAHPATSSRPATGAS